MEPASGQGMQERERVQSTELGISGNACIHSGWYPQVISQAAAVCCLVHLYFTASAWLRLKPPQTLSCAALDLSPPLLAALISIIASNYNKPSYPKASSCSPSSVPSGSTSIKSVPLKPAASAVPPEGRPSSASTQQRGGVLRALLSPIARLRLPFQQPRPAPKPASSLERSKSVGSPKTAAKVLPVGSGRQSLDTAQQQLGNGLPPLRKQSSMGHRWAPAGLARIASGQQLATEAHNEIVDVDDAISSSTVTSAAPSRRGGACLSHHTTQGPPEQQQLLLVPHSGQLAVDCVAADATDPYMSEIQQLITTEHLLQFGALLGESSAELALSQSGAAGAVGPGPDSLLGHVDNWSSWGNGWESVCTEACTKRGVHYWAWRRYLRNGLFMYKSRTVFEGVTPEQLVAFQFDGANKCAWDDTCVALRPILPPSCVATAANTPTSSAGGAGSDGGAGPRMQALMGDEELEARTIGQSAFMYARSRFPAPMAQREYLYARRVWAKADDGGVYMVSRAIPTHPAPPAPGCRVVRVKDFVSGMVIRSTPSQCGRGLPAAEVVNVYFEDSVVNAGIANLGVRKALWPLVQKTEAALRKYVVSEQGTDFVSRCSTALRTSRNSSTTAVVDSSDASEPLAAAGAEKARATPPRSGAVPEASKPPAVQAKRISVLTTLTQGLLANHKNLRSMLTMVIEYLAMLCQCCAAVHKGVQLLLMGAASVPGIWRSQLVLWLQRTAAEGQVASQDEGISEAGGRALESSSMAGGILPSSRLSSHPIRSYPDGRPHAGARKWGRKIVTKLAAVAVRAVGLPLVHHVLSRRPSTLSQFSIQDLDSVYAHQGSTGVLSSAPSMNNKQGRGGQPMHLQPHQQQHGLAPSQPLARSHSVSAPQYHDQYLYHSEYMQHYQGLQQLQARRQQQQQQQQVSGQPGAKGARQLLAGRVVVDGVPLWREGLGKDLTSHAKAGATPGVVRDVRRR